MNILLLSNYRRGTTAMLLKRGFEQAGHRLIAASPDEEAPADWRRCTRRVNVVSFMEQLDEKVDFLLVVEAGTGETFLPEGLLKCAVPTAYWAIDNHLHYRWQRLYAGLFDITFFAQKDYVTLAHGEGIGHVVWLPLAADSEYHVRPPTGREAKLYDVSFVGNIHQDRKPFFERIARELPLHVVTGVYEAGVGDIYGRSKIGLNVSINRDLNMRFFEVLASGALLVTEDIDAGMRDLFEEGIHFVAFKREAVCNVLRHYLDNEEPRLAIAAAGRERCLHAHTYRSRADEVCAVMSRLERWQEKRAAKRADGRTYVQQAVMLSDRAILQPAKALRWAGQAILRDRRAVDARLFAALLGSVPRLGWHHLKKFYRRAKKIVPLKA